jgi:hypothetical protein
MISRGDAFSAAQSPAAAAQARANRRTPAVRGLERFTASAMDLASAAGASECLLRRRTRPSKVLQSPGLPRAVVQLPHGVMLGVQSADGLKRGLTQEVGGSSCRHVATPQDRGRPWRAAGPSRISSSVSTDMWPTSQHRRARFEARSSTDCQSPTRIDVRCNPDNHAPSSWLKDLKRSARFPSLEFVDFE